MTAEKMTAEKKRRAIRAQYAGSGVPVIERPWSALTTYQRDLRLDSLGAWHKREIFLDEILKHQSLAVRERANRSTQAELHLLVRAHKQGINLVGISLEALRKEKDWSKFRKVTDAEILPLTPSGLAAPAIGGNHADLGKIFDTIAEGVSGKALVAEVALPDGQGEVFATAPFLSGT